jgi:hypothetical protein
MHHQWSRYAIQFRDDGRPVVEMARPGLGRRGSELHRPDLRAERCDSGNHNRMPVILDEKDWPKWLGEEAATEQELLALLRPCPDEWLKIWRLDNTRHWASWRRERNWGRTFSR